ncbi:MAG: hypothetical protein IJ730_03240 [Alphaproteobacteria bacterium]|nr:hypothetical protein [Alphaproteobacteria bacterium]
MSLFKIINNFVFCISITIASLYSNQIQAMNPAESPEVICEHIETLSMRTLEVLHGLGHQDSTDILQTAAASLESALQDVGHPEYIFGSALPIHYPDNAH